MKVYTLAIRVVIFAVSVVALAACAATQWSTPFTSGPVTHRDPPKGVATGVGNVLSDWK